MPSCARATTISAPTGRVMEVLSEHQCQGWLEGYLLTGRHGLFNCYEAFIHIVDSMFNQHAKWLKVTREIPWRRPIASLNYLLSSHVWRQDHNGFSHQDPGFIDHVVNKKAEIIRVYLPPDANTLLSVADHCLRSRNYVNVIVAGKQPALNYLSMDEAIVHCTRGIGIWEWASNDADSEPDVVLACCGDVPTLETLAAAAVLRERLPDLRVRVVNVVDLMRLAARVGASAWALRPRVRHPLHRPTGRWSSPTTAIRWLIHRLTYRRTNHRNLHVRGYKEEGTTTTPFDMVMLNDLDRFHLVMDVIDRVPGLGTTGGPPAPGDGRHAHPLPGVDARARRRSRRDPRLDVAVLTAWADPRPQRRLDQPEAAPGLRGDRVGAAALAGRGRPGRASTRSPTASCTAATRFREPVLVDDAVRARARPTCSRSRRCTTPPALARPRRGPAAVPRPAPRGRVRHRVPRHDPARGGDLRRPRAAGARSGACAATASTASRSRGRRGARPGGRPAAPPAAGRVPPGRRQLGDRRRRRPLGRHHDGLQPARGRAHGDALGLGRPGSARLPCCAGRAWTPTRSTMR